MTQIEQRTSDRGARLLLIAACLVILVAGLKAAASLILPFLVALFLAMVSLPLLNWLQGKGIPTPIAVLVTVVVVFAVVFGFGVLVGGSVAGFTEAAPRYRERIELMAVDALGWVSSLGVNVPQELTTDIVRPGRVMDMATTTLRGIAAVLSNLLMVSLTIVFIYLEAAGFPAEAGGGIRSIGRRRALREDPARDQPLPGHQDVDQPGDRFDHRQRDGDHRRRLSGPVGRAGLPSELHPHPGVDHRRDSHRRCWPRSNWAPATRSPWPSSSPPST